MQDKAVVGVPWTLLSYAGSKGLTLLGTVVLARLLAPEDFGVLALGLLAVQAVSIFRDLGLGGAMIVRPDLDREGLGTVLTLMLGLGLVVAVLTAVTAPLVGALFDEPQLDEVLAALSITILINGVNWFYEAFLQRELEFRKRFAGLMAQASAAVTVSIVFAALGAGVWSLVAGQLAAAVAMGVVFLAVTPARIRPRWNAGTARALLHDGKGFVLQGGLGWAQQNADYLAVGRVLGATPLGHYSMAYRMGELPYMGVADAVAKVTFPAFARMRSEGQDVRPPFLRVLAFVVLVTMPMGLLLSALADPFTAVVFGPDWAPMAPALEALGIWAAIRPLQATVAWLLNAAGQATLMGLVSLVTLAISFPALVIAASLGSIATVGWVMAVDIALSAAILLELCRRRIALELGATWRALRPMLVAAVPSWVAGRAVAESLSALSAGAALAAGTAVLLAVYAAIAIGLERGLVRESAAGLRRMAGRS